MTQEPVREREQVQLPFTARLYAALPMSPIYVGVSIAAVLIALLMVSDWTLGRFVLMSDDSIPYNPIRDLRVRRADSSGLSCICEASLHRRG